jgi:hypothetical protein
MKTPYSRKIPRCPTTGLALAVALSIGISPLPAAAKGFTRDGAPTWTQLEDLAQQPKTDSSLNDTLFGTEPIRTYPFPARGRDLDPGVFWQVTGHSSGHKRDLTATRFNQATGKWTANRANSAGLSNEEKRLIWDMPVYAPASGIVLTCWRNAPDGDDPGESGCGKNGDPNSLCRTPGGGNHVRIWIPEEQRMIHLAHFRQGTVPEHLCPHDDTHVADWTDKTGAFGFNPDILVPFPFRWVQEGDYIGRVGNSGRSGWPHLHMQMRECETPLHLDDCQIGPLLFHDADVAQKPVGRNIQDHEWVPLHGVLSVTSPRQLVRPDEGIGGFIPVPQDDVSLSQEAEGFAQIVLDVSNPESPVSDYQWERVGPTDKILEQQSSIGWQVDAVCDSGIESVRLDSPGETQIQSFPEGQEVLSGSFETQSLSTVELENLCLDWAEQQSSSKTCNQNPEVCHSSEEFDLIGGESAGTAASMVEVRVQCGDGETISATGHPRLTLQCGAIPFGFPY